MDRLRFLLILAAVAAVFIFAGLRLFPRPEALPPLPPPIALPPAKPALRGIEEPGTSRVVQVRETERAEDNLLYNGSFEEPRHVEFNFKAPVQPDWGREPEYWSPRPFIFRDTRGAADGRVALRFENMKDGYTWQVVALQPRRKYILTAKALMSGAPRGFFSLTYSDRSETYRQGAAVRANAQQSGWQTLRLELETQPDCGDGLVRLDARLGRNERLWVDDVRLVPAEGAIPEVAPVELDPPGGRFSGGLNIRLACATTSAVIRYTMDGTDPTPFSTRYTLPFRLTGPATVRARAFHAGSRNSRVTLARFEILPERGPGVPFYPAGYGQDVEAWWAGHPYNPASTNFLRRPIESPALIVSVADARQRHPESTTAGIREALDELPAEGGTLFFPRSGSPYVITAAPVGITNYYASRASVLVTNRSHLHFLSDGAELQYTNPPLAFTTTEYLREKTLQHPLRDFYFRGLIFNGLDESDSALEFRHCEDILIENCQFNRHKIVFGVITAGMRSNNFWARNCTFRKGLYGVYIDGVHNAGFLDCQFLAETENAGGIVIFTNDDMAPMSAERRNCQYVVIGGCRFVGMGRGCVLPISVANTLVVSNTAANYRTFLSQNGRGESVNVRPLRYDGTGLKILGNRTENVDCFVELLSDIRQTTPTNDLRLQTVIAGNGASNAAVALRLNTQSWWHYEMRDILCEDNEFSGTRCPRIEVNTNGGLRLYRDIVIRNNLFRGAPRPLLADLSGKPVGMQNVIRLENNRLADPP